MKEGTNKMRKCNAELMKELKTLQTEIAEIRNNITEYSIVTYYEGDDVYKDFNFEESYAKLNKLLEEERRIRTLLAYSNATTILMDYDGKTSIAEGLVKLAQLTKSLERVKRLVSKQKVIRTVVPSTIADQPNRVKVRECLYDIDSIPVILKGLKQEIARLQIAIDRTNLTNTIEC